jgi:uncharacterized protein involved in exopolysaccharide biosynthesis
VYTASVTFAPEATPPAGVAGSLAGLAGLAGQLGLPGSTAGSSSPDFFASVLRSRQLLGATLRSEFDGPATSTASRQSLLELLRVSGETPEERLEQGLKLLSTAAATTVERRTGIVTLTVRMGDRQLAADVANRMVQLLNDFNLQQRQSQYREQRRFAEERLGHAERELRAAENDLLRFLQTNRLYRGSPLLEFEASRLERAVQVKQEVYLGLTNAFEDARIAEVRDTPVLTIIDAASPPLRRSWPRRKFLVIVAALIGIVIATTMVYVLEFALSLRRADRDDYVALRTAWSLATTQMRAGYSRLTRRP